MTPKRAESSQQQSRPPNLTISRLSAAKQISSQIEKGKELQKTPIQSEEEFEVLQQKYYTWDEYNCELLKRIFDNDQVYQEYRSYSFGFYEGTLSQNLESLNDDFSGAIRRLESIRERLPLIPEPIGQTIQSQAVSTKKQETTKEVFIVHGTDQGIKESLARYLSKLGLIPIILHEQPNLGDTIIEKLERKSTVAYSIVLLTGDDKAFPIGNPSSTKLRARQNVAFELGYFIGKLGREKVCALYSEGVELPSDFQGIVYIPLDQAGAWRLLLARELKASGIDIDLNNAL